MIKNNKIKNQERELFENYMKLQSNEWKANILGYEHFEQSGHDVIIKVNFRDGNWLRVYMNPKYNQIEWY